SAARRETREETGLEVEVTGILSVSSNFLSAALHALVVAVAARPVGGTLRAGDDLCDLCWVPVTGPYPPLAYEADAHLLRGMARGSLPVLPVDRRYATTPRLRPYTSWSSFSSRRSCASAKMRTTCVRSALSSKASALRSLPTISSCSRRPCSVAVRENAMRATSAHWHVRWAAMWWAAHVARRWRAGR